MISALKSVGTIGFAISRFSISCVATSTPIFSAAIIVFLVGRLLFAWLADRVYARHYNK